MEITRSGKNQHLKLDDLTLNPKLARRLPQTVACWYHAVPVAEDNGQITVAMANPNDAIARDAVADALGQSSCIVGGDPAAIDALLAEVWRDAAPNPASLLVCAHSSPIADQVSAYARALGGLLGAHVSYFNPLPGQDLSCEAVARVLKQGVYDLVIWGEPEMSVGRQLLSGTLYRKAIQTIDGSLLIARQPRWPLKRLLLVVRGEAVDNVAVDWVVRLARPSGAAITVLAVVPPVPAMYHASEHMHVRLDTLLTTDTALGQQMRRIAHELVDGELKGTLRLRQGPLDAQICREIAEEDYDLLAVAARFHKRASRLLLGDRVTSLLCCADRPLLIAKSKTA